MAGTAPPTPSVYDGARWLLRYAPVQRNDRRPTSLGRLDRNRPTGLGFYPIPRELELMVSQQPSSTVIPDTVKIGDRLVRQGMLAEG